MRNAVTMTLVSLLALAALRGPAADAPPPDRRQVQAAVAGGLKWLAGSQVKDGSQAGSWDAAKYQTAVASLAGLAFLANGYQPGEGDYGQVVDRAMGYVQASMTADGYLGARDQTMYVHAICTLFGLAYLGLNPEAAKEQELAEWCRRSLKLIVEAQQTRKPRLEQGGWRYSPYLAESDLSVTSWQLLVLHSARQCGYTVDDAVISSALAYVNSAFAEAGDRGSGFLYRPGVSKDPEPAVTGVALFTKSLYEPVADERVAKSLRFLTDYPPAWGGKQYNGYFFFGVFYMAQGMFQIGGESWATYAPRLCQVLVEHQQGDGHWDLPPDNRPQSRDAGLAYPTAMAVLILSLEKQYLPMYQRQKKLF